MRLVSGKKKFSMRVLVGTLLLVELVLQLIGYVRYLSKVKEEIVSENAKVSGHWFFSNPEFNWWNREITGELDLYHPLVGWVAKPFTSPKYNVDQNNIRVTLGNPPISEQENLENIAFFGGSTMLGLYLADEETIPTYVAQTLNNDQPTVFVTNYGQTGFTSTQSLVHLLLELKRGRIPDTVIFYDGCNDLSTKTAEVPTTVYNEVRLREVFSKIKLWKKDSTVVNTTLINPNLWVKTTAFIFEHIKLLHYPVKFLNNGLGIENNSVQTVEVNYINSEQADIYAHMVARTYLEVVDSVTRLSQAYGFDVLFLWQPLYFNKPLTGNEFKIPSYFLPREGASNVYKKAIDIIQSKEIDGFYSLVDVFKDYQNEDIFIDSCHVSGFGNKIIAEEVVRLLKNRPQN